MDITDLMKIIKNRQLTSILAIEAVGKSDVLLVIIEKRLALVETVESIGR